MIAENDGYGNTRPKQESSVEAHCDYLRIAITHYDAEKFESLLSFIAPKYNCEPETPWSPGAGAVWFPHRVSAIKGVRGGWVVDDEEGIAAMIDLPGEYWEMLTPIEQWRKFRGLKHTYNVRPCRVDIAVDDPSYQVIPIEEMRKAYHSGSNYYFKKYRYHSTTEEPGAKPFVTDEFGSRNSGKFVRVYDHERECLRFESEFKRGYAPEVFDVISDLERPAFHYDVTSTNEEELTEEEMDAEWNLEIMRVMAGIAVGAIDFRNRGTSKSASTRNARDAKRLPFYQKFIDFLQTTSLRVRKREVPRTLIKTLGWVKRQCSGTLAMFKEGFGTADWFIWINQLAELGRERMGREKFQWADEISKYKHRFRIA